MKETYPNIQAEINFIFKFSSYQGICQSKENQKEDFTECNQEISYIKEGFSKDPNSNYWAPLQCKKVKEDCYVKIQCKSCEVTGPSFIQVSLQEEKSYSSAIQFNVTSTSSIPNEVSSIDIAINPDSQMIFRGPEPSVLEVLIIPSAYETNDPKQSKYDGQTGYHVMNSGYYYKGTQFSSTEMQFSSNLYARINLKPSESSLLTKQILKTSAFTLITAVLGSVFGLMGVIGKVMSFIEKYKSEREKQIKKVFDMVKNTNFNRQTKHLREQHNINPLQIKKKAKRFSVRKAIKKINERRASNQVFPQSGIEDMYEECSDSISPLQQHLDLLKQQQQQQHKNRIQNQNASTEYLNSIKSQGQIFTFPGNSIVWEENISQQHDVNKKGDINEDSEMKSLICEDIE